MSDYSKRKLYVDEKDLDIGLDILNIGNSFVSNYRTGSVMNIEVESFHNVIGKIVDKETGEVIALKTIKINNRTKRKKDISFSDDDGSFSFYHIEEGHYDVTVFRPKSKTRKILRFQFKTNKNSKNIIDLGILKI